MTDQERVGEMDQMKDDINEAMLRAVGIDPEPEPEVEPLDLGDLPERYEQIRQDFTEEEWERVRKNVLHANPLLSEL